MAVTITWSSQKFQLILGYMEIFNSSRGVPVCGKQKKVHGGKEKKAQAFKERIQHFSPHDLLCHNGKLQNDL